MKAYYYIKTIKTWVALKYIVSLFSDGQGWTVKMSDGSKYPLASSEYEELSAFFEEANKKIADKQD